MDVRFDRQRLHLSDHPSLDETPPHAVIAASLTDELSVSPVGPVLEDKQLDELEASDDAEDDAGGPAAR